MTPYSITTTTWIDFLRNHGGYFTLLGAPALFASVAFIHRIRWLKRHKQPHTYGRTAFIYWPSQLLLALACLVLLFLIVSQWVNASDKSYGLAPGAIAMLITCSIAIILNKNEHLYEIRSSDYLLLYYLCTIFTCSISIYILQGEAEPSDLSLAVAEISSLRLLSTFTITIILAFLFEAIPRTNTRVQQESREKEYLSDYDQANLFSRITYHYIQRIVSLGATRSLNGEDLKNTAPGYLKTRVNFKRISASWESSVAQSRASHGRRSPSLILTVLSTYRIKIATMLVVRLIALGLIYLAPMLLSRLLRFIDEYGSTSKGGGRNPPQLKEGFLITTGILVCNVLSSLLFAFSMAGNMDVGISAYVAIEAMIYRKSMTLSPQARQKSTLGEITNHMSVDAEKWLSSAYYLPHIITSPIELVLGIYMLYSLLGWSLIAGLTVFAIIMSIHAKMARSMNGYQDEMLRFMDLRLRLVTEILSNIKTVKLYGWEDAFRKKIDAFRTKELSHLKPLATIRSISKIGYSSISLVMALATFAIYSTIGGPNMAPGKMTPQIVFVSISLFSMLNEPLGMASYVISQTIALRIANLRIQTFLLQEELDTTIVQRYSRQPPRSSSNKGRKDQNLSIDIENGTFAWETEVDLATTDTTDSADYANDVRQPLLSGSSTAVHTPARPVLNNINLQIPEGHLTAVVGRIGQGKTSLLSAIMGEMYKKQGTVKIYGDLAYVPQQAWIINATIRDNIVFGRPFDQQLYDRIIYASGLRPDFEMLPAGDHTEIGERGINLSGGQKQRVSLARAAYQDADVYLLDDPLSAVDAHVDQHLWSNLIGPNGLLKNKTRVLVTHGIHHLEHVDQIVVFKDGMISETGEYRQLINARGAFHQLIKDYLVTTTSKHKNDSSKGENDPDEDSQRKIHVAEEATVTKDDGGDNRHGIGELVTEEKMEDGRVGWDVAATYARAVSYRKTFICVVLFILGQGSHISTNFWLRYWINDAGHQEREVQALSYYLAIYGLLIVVYTTFDVAINYFCEVTCGMQGSIALHERLLTRVLRLPMSFFDTTPMGRIVNRFSSDINSVDTILPEEINRLFTFLTFVGGTLALIAYSTPAFLLAIPFLGIAVYIIQDYYIKSAGSLTRLFSISKSPLFQHFSESLAGVSTIRATKGLREQFILQNEVLADTVVDRMNMVFILGRWLQVRLEIVGAVAVFLFTSLAVVNVDRLDSSLIGLTLTYGLGIITLTNYLVRTVSEVQNLLVSVERIQEYSERPMEAPAVTGVRLPQNWPQQGLVVFKHYSARYRVGLDLAVKDVSFTVEPGQKIGIVGRSGAGKSSLTLALFRIIEAADSYWALASDPSSSDSPIEPAIYSSGAGGLIEIDGIDISTLGLRDLRQHLAIIPQDPTLFAGTVRDNLDPLNELSDSDIWEALERAHLKAYISSLAGGLSFEVAQNGGNFSVGQRSLICLARAMLRKTKVLILDEATAAVDVETDDLIQKTIRKEFQDRTILTIAHRIKTVMDSDQILVLENGRVQEFEAPSKLLDRRTSLFYSLARQAGEI
ncbi:Multidrug resistance-associated protein 1 [Mortierella sp. AD094]|nr:Multidrug resistance-associated protein 1 [Mortierella sp. AD094]